jgi:hypothetical protein
MYGLPDRYSRGSQHTVRCLCRRPNKRGHATDLSIASRRAELHVSDGWRYRQQRDVPATDTSVGQSHELSSRKRSCNPVAAQPGVAVERLDRSDFGMQMQ